MKCFLNYMLGLIAVGATSMYVVITTLDQILVFNRDPKIAFLIGFSPAFPILFVISKFLSRPGN